MGGAPHGAVGDCGRGAIVQTLWRGAGVRGGQSYLKHRQHFDTSEEAANERARRARGSVREGGAMLLHGIERKMGDGKKKKEKKEKKTVVWRHARAAFAQRTETGGRAAVCYGGGRGKEGV